MPNTEIKTIEFVESENHDYAQMRKSVDLWYAFNKGNIKIITAVDTGKQGKRFTNDWRRAIVIRYTGEAEDPKNCTHPNTTHKRTESTCQTEGIDVEICTKCGVIVSTTPIPKIDHKWKWVNNGDATCTSDETKTGTCTMCHVQKKESIPGTALGHDYPDEWITETEATCETPGLEYRLCRRCGNRDERVIETLPHTWHSNRDGTHTCVSENGCNTTEQCSPNTPGSTCSKCGYMTPPDEVEEEEELRIITEYIDGMVVGQEYEMQFEHNKPRLGVGIWDLVSGQLPSGMQLGGDTGVLYGTPQVSGIFSISIQLRLSGIIVRKDYTINIASVECTVMFDPGDGIVEEEFRNVPKGSTIGILPVPTRDGYIFGGWFTAEIGGLKVDELYTVSADVTLYARWGESDSDIVFGDATSSFNMSYEGDRTNYGNAAYTIYHRMKDGGTDKLVTQIGIASDDGTNNMTSSNKHITLYMKVTNNGEAGNFDIGFDCDSYVPGFEPSNASRGDDSVVITRIANGVRVGDEAKNKSTYAYTVTSPYDVTAWVGEYNKRTSNRYADVSINTSSGVVDSGYCFNMNNIFINKNSYVILEINFIHA